MPAPKRSEVLGPSVDLSAELFLKRLWTSFDENLWHSSRKKYFDFGGDPNLFVDYGDSNCIVICVRQVAAQLSAEVSYRLRSLIDSSL